MKVLRAALTGLAVLLAAACTNPADTVSTGADVASESAQESGGSGDGSDSSDDSGRSGDGDSNDSGGDDDSESDDDSSGVVIGSPITIPSFQQVGARFVDVFPGMLAELEEACEDQDPCVEVEVQAEDGRGAESTCAFAGTDPAGGEEVEPGSTVTFLTRQPCDESPDDGGEEETEGETGGEGESSGTDDGSSGSTETSTETSTEGGSGETGSGASASPSAEPDESPSS